ncbi:MAG: transposase [Candidatus Omnitrophica bacterium]|nr:transposase [Candidatus Omnitrophota bacterium]
MYAIDWAVKKELRIYDVQRDKIKSIPPTLEAFAKFLSKLKGATNFYFEEGGGDSFKLQARRTGHEVYTIPGKEIKEYRDKLGLTKSDVVDAVVIGKFAKLYPGKFYQFRELDEITARIAILFKGRKDIEQTLVRQKNRLFALKMRLELVSLDGHKAKIIKRAERVIKALESDFEGQTRLLEIVLKDHPMSGYFGKIKGVGPAVAGGMISTIKRAGRFDNKGSLRHYAGMVAKKGDQKFQHDLKRALYFFCVSIIKARTPRWRKLYDDMKIYYQDKHPDWKKGHVNNYAMKFVETKFLDQVYSEMKKIEGGELK